MAKTAQTIAQSISSLRKRRRALVAQISVPENFIRASYVEQYLTCGKKNCRCRRRGSKHGPFFYLVRCLARGRVKKFLLRTPEQRRQARASIAAHLKFLRALSELSEINAELLRRGGR